MRRSILLLMSALALAGCSKSLDEPAEMTEIVVSADLGYSRVAQTYNESLINDLQLLVFLPDSTKIYYAKSSSRTVSINLYTGYKYILYLVANSSNDLSTVTSISDLLGRSSYASTNTRSSFEMVGSSGLIVINPAQQIRIPMERFVARFTISDLWTSIDCENDCFQSATMKWITFNLSPASCTYGFKPSSSYMTGNFVTGSRSDVFCAYFDNVIYMTPACYFHVSTPVSFYTYPDYGLRHALRRDAVMLISGTDSNGLVCRHYCSFSVPTMEHNCCYVIDVLRIYDIEKSSDLDCTRYSGLETRSLASGEAHYYKAKASYNITKTDMYTGESTSYYETFE